MKVRACDLLLLSSHARDGGLVHVGGGVAMPERAALQPVACQRTPCSVTELDLCQCGWHHASEEEIIRHQMSHRKLRSIVYGGLC
jgi:hypothetical protein